MPWDVRPGSMAEELLFQSRGCRGQPRFLLRATGQMRNEAPRGLGFQCKEQAQVRGPDQRWLWGLWLKNPRDQ